MIYFYIPRPKIDINGILLLLYICGTLKSIIQFLLETLAAIVCALNNWDIQRNSEKGGHIFKQYLHDICHNSIQHQKE